MKTPTEKEIRELLLMCRAAAPLRQGKRNAKKLVSEKDSKQLALFSVGNRCASTEEGKAGFAMIYKELNL